MTKRQFYIAISVILALTFVIGPASYFSYRARLAEQETMRAITKERLDASKELSKNRWEAADKMLKRLPFTSND